MLSTVALFYLLLPSSAYATLIDFELLLDGSPPVIGIAVGNQYQDQGLLFSSRTFFSDLSGVTPALLGDNLSTGIFGRGDVIANISEGIPSANLRRINAIEATFTAPVSAVSVDVFSNNSNVFLEALDQSGNLLHRSSVGNPTGTAGHFDITNVGDIWNLHFYGGQSFYRVYLDNLDYRPASQPISLTSPVHPIRLTSYTVTTSGIPGDVAPTTTVGFDPTAPTYVITHGWQPVGRYTDEEWNFETTQRPEVMGETLSAIERRFALHNTAVKANVILAEWEGAYTGGGGSLVQTVEEVLLDDVIVADASTKARVNADFAGLLLGKSLGETLGANYTHDMHFIGHSYGTVVNGIALQYLSDSGWFNEMDARTVQFTALDAPTVRNHFAPNLTSDWFSINLPGHVDVLDNYYGTGLLAFGQVLPGASFNLQVDESHGGVWSEFYVSVIDHSAAFAGVSDWFTPMLGTAWSFEPRIDGTRQFIRGINGSTTTNLLERTIELWSDPTEVDFINLVNAETVKIDTFTFVNCDGYIQDLFKTCLESSTTHHFDGVRVKEQSPVSFAQHVTIPVDARYLAFDWLIGDGGDGDWFTVSFDDAVIWSMGIDPALEGIVFHALVDVSSFAGAAGDLVFTLHSIGAANADLYIGGLAFFTVAGTVPEPAMLLSFALGFAGIAGLSGRGGRRGAKTGQNRRRTQVGAPASERRARGNR